ncbi:MAG: Acetyltransferase [Conexibacter sp.]|nr:Acetyltransferase [Conexibacter sp.]
MGPLSLAEWVGLTGREPAPFGERSAGLVWRPKERHVGLREADGRLAAVGGAALVTVAVDGGEPFDVVGFGGLIIRRDVRGGGLMPVLMDALVEVALGLGPDRAMIFCEAHLAEIYRRRGYAAITDAVSIDQPGGRVVMPLTTMWRALRPGAGWPPGAVEVAGLPF